MNTPKPQFLYMEVNEKCNLRCNHCFYWEREDHTSRYLPTERQAEICEEMAEMNPRARLVVCGGEPMLDRARYYGLCGAGRAAGLRVLSVVNGTRIKTPAEARRVLQEGPHEVSISFDDWRAEEHDKMRGVPNAFLQAKTAVRLLVAAKQELRLTDSRIIVMGLIHRYNYETLPEFYDFVLNQLGADKLKLNFAQPSFGLLRRKDEFYKEYAQVDVGKLTSLMWACNERFGLDLNRGFVESVSDYFLSISAVPREFGWAAPAITRSVICNSGERNIMVDHYGMARLCFAPVFPGVQLRKRGDLRALWEGADWRPEMRRCRRQCGISHSVRREPSTNAGWLGR